MIYTESLTILMLVLWFDEVVGGWTYFKEMALRLANAGVKVIVVSPRAKHNKRKEKIKGIKVYRYSSIYFPQIPLILVNPIDFLSTLKEIIKEEKHVDLIYDTTSAILPSSLLAKLLFKLKGMKIPLIIHVHGELKDLESKKLLSLLFELYLYSVTRLCFAIADKILLAGGKILTRVLSLGAHPNKLKVVHVGLKYEDRLNNPTILCEAEKNKLRTSIGLCEKDFIIGYVGRLSPGKGLDTLLQAVARVKDAIPSLKVLLIGDGGEKSRLKMLTSRLGINDLVIFLGHRDDVPSLLQIMDVFVNLSVSEAGISASQIEAMQYCLPCIITPFTDFLNNLDEAIIVPFNNTQAVCDALLLLYANEFLRKKIGLKAAAKAQSLIASYSWSNYLHDALEVFREVAAH